MAKATLAACKGCGQAVSIYADKCPGCGQPRKRQLTPSEQGGCLVVLGLTAVCVFLCAGPCTPSSSKPKPIGGDEIGAKVMAQQFVEERLKAPSTAKFPWGGSTAAKEAGRWRVRGSVDSQNSFGAMIRSNYECVLENTSGDNWRCHSLIIDGTRMR